MSRQVQIPEELFLDLLRWHSFEIRDPEAEERIRHGLETKLDAMARRQMYTDSKTAATPEERDAARQRYLDAVGIHPNFRW